MGNVGHNWTQWLIGRQVEWNECFLGTDIGYVVISYWNIMKTITAFNDTLLLTDFDYYDLMLSENFT